MSYALRCRLTSRLICSVVTCFVLLGGWKAAEGNPRSKGQTQLAHLGRPFNLRAGRQVTLKGETLRIKFVAVENDSRCPSDVKCVWAGNAAVRLEVSMSRRDSKSLTLNTSRSSALVGETQYRGYKLRLVGLDPYPRSDQKIAAGDYTVTLLVSKERATSKAGASVK
jgi:hypothetical protein